MTSYHTDGKSGPWAEEKWRCLQAYLDSYTKALKYTRFKTFYIDAFAGTGVSEIRRPAVAFDDQLPVNIDLSQDPDHREFALGSPLRALDITHPFSGYFFVEPDKDRAAQLRESISGHPLEGRCRIREMDAQTALLHRVVDNPKLDWRYCRAVCFLDPFGMQVDWRILEALASTRAIEIILNFPLGTTIRRHLSNTGELPGAWVERLDRFFGSDEWRSAVYTDEPSLFGNLTRKHPSAENLLLDWYVERLRHLFGHTAVPRLIRNSRGSHLYYLIWAGPHSRGKGIADHVLGRMAT